MASRTSNFSLGNFLDKSGVQGMYMYMRSIDVWASPLTLTSCYWKPLKICLKNIRFRYCFICFHSVIVWIIACVQSFTVVSRLWHVNICEEIWKIFEWEGFLVHRNGIWLLPTQKRVSYICLQHGHLYVNPFSEAVVKFSSTRRCWFCHLFLKNQMNNIESSRLGPSSTE